MTDDKRLGCCHEMHIQAQPVDDPNVPPLLYGQFRGWWAHGFEGSPVQAWLATDDCGDPVGAYLLELPHRENLANAFGHLMVAPHLRRRGAGRALLAHMAGAAALADRKLLMGFTRIGSPGTPFAKATGGQAGLLDTRRILDVDASLRERLPALRASAESRAAGYSLRYWPGVSPEDLIDGICATYTAMGDAPHDDNFEPASWDAGRMRAAEERVIAQGTRMHSIAAIEDGSGEVAALTQVNVDPGRPQWGWQEITAVISLHRGHRLGLLVKVAMLDLLAGHEPELRHMATYNADQNKHMVAVNTQLGYHVTDYFQSWEHEIASARALAS